MCKKNLRRHLLLHSKVTDNLVRCSQVKARNQIIKKLIQYQIVHLYAQHEIEDALVKYAAATDANRAELGVVWDEFWAFYAGSMETGTGNGVGAYTNAESRSDFFQTPGSSATSTNGPKSMVNDFLLKAAQNGRDLIKTAGNGEKLNDIAKCIRAQIKVPLLQGCIMYAYKADVHTPFTKDDDAAKVPAVENKAEMWAFCSGALPYLAAVDATAVCVCIRLTCACKFVCKYHVM